MELDVQTKGRAVIARLHGELDLVSALELKQRLEPLLVPGVLTLVLNVEGLTFMDSSGLGVILGRYRQMRELGGDLVLAGAGPMVRNILEISGITRIVALCDVEEGTAQ